MKLVSPPRRWKTVQESLTVAGLFACPRWLTATQHGITLANIALGRSG